MPRIAALSLSLLVLIACKSREEKLQAEEDKGNFLLSSKARLVKGVGEALKSEGSEAAGVLSEGTGEVVKAVGGGFDRSLEQVKLVVHEGLAPKGINATRAALASRSSKSDAHGVSVYLTLEQAYTGNLELRAFDARGAEIGRTKLAIDEAEATGKYVDFEFDQRTPLLTAGHFELR